MPVDLDKLDDLCNLLSVPRDDEPTHWEECWREHPICRIERMAEAIRELRRQVAALQATRTVTVSPALTEAEPKSVTRGGSTVTRYESHA